MYLFNSGKKRKATVLGLILLLTGSLAFPLTNIKPHANSEYSQQNQQSNPIEFRTDSESASSSNTADSSQQSTERKSKLVAASSFKSSSLHQTPASRGSGISNNLISYALKFIGIPYVWGGTSPRGFDCSGFVQYVYAKEGLPLPRTSFEQFKTGHPVSVNNLLPGDLVFFSTNGPGASHVGIYMGGGEFVQASPPRIKVSPLAGHYASRLVGARRIS